MQLQKREDDRPSRGCNGSEKEREREREKEREAKRVEKVRGGGGSNLFLE